MENILMYPENKGLVDDNVDGQIIDDEEAENLKEQLVLSAKMGQELLSRLETLQQELDALREDNWRLESDKTYYERQNEDLTQDLMRLRHENLNLFILQSNNSSSMPKSSDDSKIASMYTEVIAEKELLLNKHISEIEQLKEENISLIERLLEVQLEADANSRIRSFSNAQQSPERLSANLDTPDSSKRNSLNSTPTDYFNLKNTSSSPNTPDTPNRGDKPVLIETEFDMTNIAPDLPAQNEEKLKINIESLRKELASRDRIIALMNEELSIYRSDSSVGPFDPRSRMSSGVYLNTNLAQELIQGGGKDGKRSRKTTFVLPSAPTTPNYSPRIAALQRQASLGAGLIPGPNLGSVTMRPPRPGKNVEGPNAARTGNYGTWAGPKTRSRSRSHDHDATATSTSSATSTLRDLSPSKPSVGGDVDGLNVTESVTSESVSVVGMGVGVGIGHVSSADSVITLQTRFDSLQHEFNGMEKRYRDEIVQLRETLRLTQMATAQEQETTQTQYANADGKNAETKKLRERLILHHDEGKGDSDHVFESERQTISCWEHLCGFMGCLRPSREQVCLLPKDQEKS